MVKVSLYIICTHALKLCDTYAGVSASAWFKAGDLPKEDLQLRVEQLHILAAEDLGNKVPTFQQDMSCNIQCL